MNRTQTIQDSAALWSEAKRVFLNDPQHALELLDRAEEALDETASEDLQARILLTRASAAQVALLPEITDRSLHEAFAWLEQHPDPRLLASAYNIRAIEASQRGCYGNAMEFLEKALVQGRICGEPEVIGHLCNNLALDFLYVGETDRAAEYLKESMEAWDRAEADEGRAQVLLNIGLLHEQQGDSEAAIEYYQQSIERFRSAGIARGVVKAHINTATALEKLGHRGKAIQCSRAALDVARSLNDPLHLAHALDNLASLLANTSDAAQVRPMYDDALRLYKAAECLRGEALVHQHVARLHPEASMERKDALTQALDHANRAGVMPVVAEIRRDLAGLSQARGEWPEAFRHLSEAAAIEKKLLSEKAARHREALRVAHHLDQAQQIAEQERMRSGKLADALEEVERLRALAEEESRQKTTLLKMAAHDLRNLAGGVRQCLGMIRENMHCSPESREFEELIEMASKASHTLFDTLSDLMNAAVIERGRLEIFPAPVDLTEFLEETAKTWSPILAVKGQTIHCHVAKGLSVDGDLTRLREIVENLLNNASKFSAPGTSVSLCAASDGDAITVHFDDEGPGISESEQRLLFRPFQTLSNRPTNKESSTGLGLHIVKTLVELHGGTVSMENRQTGGSRFTLRFPAAVRFAQPQDASRREARRRRSRP